MQEHGHCSWEFPHLGKVFLQMLCGESFPSVLSRVKNLWINLLYLAFGQVSDNTVTPQAHAYKRGLVVEATAKARVY